MLLEKRGAVWSLGACFAEHVVARGAEPLAPFGGRVADFELAGRGVRSSAAADSCDGGDGESSGAEDLLKDLAHQQGFLESVVKKLSNERFVSNAKAEVIDLEKKKKADAEARIKTIEESLAGL